jgi:2-methylisocitrate lyase-like PEP mutase family enzyme
MTGVYDTEEAIRRLVGFEQAGADCLYAPLPPDMAALAKICAATTAPINALVAGNFTKQDQAAFGKIGVARLSLGSAFARITHRAMHDAALAMIGDGDFSPLQNGMSGDAVDQMLT